MRTRRIGSLEVGAVGLGCMPMSTTYGVPNARESVATINAAIDAGVNLLDTADMYGAGGNERLVGGAIKSRRSEVVLASKFGIIASPAVGIPLGLGASPQRCRHCLDASLQRLGTDWIDLYYLHRVDPHVPIEETVGAMADLVHEGKVREIGVCEVTGDQLRRAQSTHPIAAVQSEWSLFSRGIEDEQVAAARQLGIAIVAFSPLGRGLLTGDPRSTTRLPLLDVRRWLPRWQRSNLEHNLRMVERLRQVSVQMGMTSAQVALAWLLHQGADVIPIPGTSRRDHLRQNLNAIDVALPPEALRVLDGVWAMGDRGEGFGRK